MSFNRRYSGDATISDVIYEVKKYPRNMSKSSSLNLGVISLCVVLLGACTSTSTKIATVYEKSDFDTGPFDRFLVVGISENLNSRQRFEAAMVNALSDRDIAAVASTRVMESHVPLNRDTITAAASETGSDAVFVSRLKSLETKAEMIEGRTDLKVTRKGDNLVDFFRKDYESVTDIDDLQVTRTVIIASDVFDVSSAEKVWGVESTTFGKEGRREAISSMSAAIVAKLKRDGLAR